MSTSNTEVVTGKVRISYEHIFEAVAIQEGQTPKYSASFIVPKSDKVTLRKIQSAIEAAKAAGKSIWGGTIPPNLKLPLRDGDADRPDDAAYKDAYFINANSSRQPAVVDRNRNEVLKRDEVYSG